MAKIAVAPLVGARIEIACAGREIYIMYVAPLVGARIEISSGEGGVYWRFHVAPLVGARIEIPLPKFHQRFFLSLPSWERGLKFVKFGGWNEGHDGRSPRGSED